MKYADFDNLPLQLGNHHDIGFDSRLTFVECASPPQRKELQELKLSLNQYSQVSTHPEQDDNNLPQGTKFFSQLCHIQHLLFITIKYH